MTEGPPKSWQGRGTPKPSGDSEAKVRAMASWSAAGSEAPRRFGLVKVFGPGECSRDCEVPATQVQSAVAAALCRHTPKPGGETRKRKVRATAFWSAAGSATPRRFGLKVSGLTNEVVFAIVPATRRQ